MKNLLNKLSCFCISIAWVIVHHNTQYLFSLMQNDLQICKNTNSNLVHWPMHTPSLDMA